MDHISSIGRCRTAILLKFFIRPCEHCCLRVRREIDRFPPTGEDLFLSRVPCDATRPAKRSSGSAPSLQNLACTQALERGHRNTSTIDRSLPPAHGSITGCVLRSSLSPLRRLPLDKQACDLI